MDIKTAVSRQLESISSLLHLPVYHAVHAPSHQGLSYFISVSFIPMSVREFPSPGAGYRDGWFVSCHARQPILKVSDLACDGGCVIRGRCFGEASRGTEILTTGILPCLWPILLTSIEITVSPVLRALLIQSDDWNVLQQVIIYITIVIAES